MQVLATQAMIYLLWHTKSHKAAKHINIYCIAQELRLIKGVENLLVPAKLRLDNNSIRLAKLCIPLNAPLNAELLRTGSDLSNKSSVVQVRSYLRVSKQSANSNAQFTTWNCRIAILFKPAP